MKTLKSIAVAAALLLAGSCGTVRAEEINYTKSPVYADNDNFAFVLPGDCDSDGIFSVADILKFKNWMLDADDISFIKNADFDQNGTVNIADLCRMKEKLIDPDEKYKFITLEYIEQLGQRNCVISEEDFKGFKYYSLNADNTLRRYPVNNEYTLYMECGEHIKLSLESIYNDNIDIYSEFLTRINKEPLLMSERVNYAWSKYQSFTVVCRDGSVYSFPENMVKNRDEIYNIKTDAAKRELRKLIAASKPEEFLKAPLLNDMKKLAYKFKTEGVPEKKTDLISMMNDYGQNSLWLSGSEPVELATLGDSFQMIDDGDVKEFVDKSVRTRLFADRSHYTMYRKRSGMFEEGEITDQCSCVFEDLSDIPEDPGCMTDDISFEDGYADISLNIGYPYGNMIHELDRVYLRNGKLFIEFDQISPPAVTTAPGMRSAVVCIPEEYMEGIEKEDIVIDINDIKGYVLS